MMASRQAAALFICNKTAAPATLMRWEASHVVRAIYQRTTHPLLVVAVLVRVQGPIFHRQSDKGGSGIVA